MKVVRKSLGQIHLESSWELTCVERHGWWHISNNWNGSGLIWVKVISKSFSLGQIILSQIHLKSGWELTCIQRHSWWYVCNNWNWSRLIWV